MKLPILSEYDECKVFAEYLTFKGYLFSHIPNETYTPHWGTRRKLKVLGVHAGVPDYIIIVKNKLCFIEMKRKKGGKTLPEQKIWLDKLADCGTKCYIAYGADSAIAFIEKIAKL